MNVYTFVDTRLEAFSPEYNYTCATYPEALDMLLLDKRWNSCYFLLKEVKWGVKTLPLFQLDLPEPNNVSKLN